MYGNRTWEGFNLQRGRGLRPARTWGRGPAEQGREPAEQAEAWAGRARG